MKQKHPVGLGDPLPEGKMVLFQPPRSSTNSPIQLNNELKRTEKRKALTRHENKEEPSSKRIRTTIDLSSEALVILQQIQQDHRLRTGHSLPIWKALSQIISSYNDSK